MQKAIDVKGLKSVDLELKALQLGLESQTNYELMQDLLGAEDFDFPKYKELFLILSKFPLIPEPEQLAPFMENLDYKLLTEIYLFRGVSSYENATLLFKQLSDLRKRRDIAFKTSQAIRLIENLDEPLEKTLTALEIANSEILKDKSDDIFTPAEQITQFDNYLASPIQRTPTRFKNLDLFTNGGYGAGQFWVIGSRPSVGKTALCNSLLDSLSIENEDPSVLFSIEMTRIEIMLRLAAISTNIEAFRIEKGFLTIEERQKVEEWKLKFKKRNLHIVDRASLFPDDLERLTKIYVRKYGVKAIFVDYLQKMKSRQKNRIDQIREISGTCKELALKHKITTVAMAQFNREADKLNRRNMISDLRDSGDIEQDADLIAILERPSYGANPRDKFFDGTPDHTGKGCLIHIDKHRGGRTGKIMTYFEKEYTKFVEATNDLRIDSEETF